MVPRGVERQGRASIQTLDGTILNVVSNKKRGKTGQPYPVIPGPMMRHRLFPPLSLDLMVDCAWIEALTVSATPFHGSVFLIRFDACASTVYKPQYFF